MGVRAGVYFFFFNVTATTATYTLSLHDALPNCLVVASTPASWTGFSAFSTRRASRPDRKSTRLNSSHTVTSYAVFCLKKKKENTYIDNNDAKKARKPTIRYA